MANKKVITVNESSLVDLKAELYRKETRLKREKTDTSLTKKAPIWQKKKKDKNKDKKNVVEKPQSNEYNKELEKSRLMLEAKSALYEKLSSGEIEVPSDEDESDGRFLVDFHQKSITKENDNNTITDETTDAPPVHPDNEWVDYVDSFGRSKKCLRKDLPLMKEKDEISKPKDLKPELSTRLNVPTLLSDDMRREMIRQAWEKEMEETLDKPLGPIHYQDVLAHEIRDHGVGYYTFSKAEEERQEQQTLLKKLRTQTEQQRDKRDKLLQKRKAAMDARLAKVKERKLKKLKEHGLVTDEDEKALTEKSSDVDKVEQETTIIDENEMTINNMVERIRNENTRSEKPNEWETRKVDLTAFDKPKPKVPKYDPHSERDPDFAPPSSYTKSENHKFKKGNWNHKKQADDTNSERNPAFSPPSFYDKNPNNETDRWNNETGIQQDNNTDDNNTDDNKEGIIWSTQNNLYGNTNYFPQNTSIPQYSQDAHNVFQGTCYIESIPPNVHPPENQTQPLLPLSQNPYLNSFLPPQNYGLPNTPPLYRNIPTHLPPPPIHAFPPPSVPHIPSHGYELPPLIPSQSYGFPPPTLPVGGFPPHLPPPPTHSFPPPLLPPSSWQPPNATSDDHNITQPSPPGVEQ